jgi:hypothetical protein
LPSTLTSEIAYPLLGVIVNVTESPDLTVTAPLGEIEPPIPAVAVIMKALIDIDLKIPSLHVTA